MNQFPQIQEKNQQRTRFLQGKFLWRLGIRDELEIRGKEVNISIRFHEEIEALMRFLGDVEAGAEDHTPTKAGSQGVFSSISENTCQLEGLY